MSTDRKLEKLEIRVILYAATPKVVIAKGPDVWKTIVNATKRKLYARPTASASVCLKLKIDPFHWPLL